MTDNERAGGIEAQQVENVREEGSDEQEEVDAAKVDMRDHLDEFGHN